MRKLLPIFLYIHLGPNDSSAHNFLDIRAKVANMRLIERDGCMRSEAQKIPQGTGAQRTWTEGKIDDGRDSASQDCKVKPLGSFRQSRSPVRTRATSSMRLCLSERFATNTAWDS